MSEQEELLNDEESDELYEHHRLVADGGQGLLRVDKFLANQLRKISRNKIQESAKAGSVHVNGVAVKSNYKIKPGDVVQVVLAHPPRDIELLPEDIPLEIVYEDKDLCIVNKPAGMVVHPAYGHYRGTLVNAVLFHMQKLPKGSAAERPGLVHRLDKNTSGLMVLALNEHAMAHLSKQFFERSTDRLYTALVWGDLEKNEGRIEGHIGRSLQDRKRMTVFPDGSMGKYAATNYKVLQRFGFVTLVECKLETGRTHQIRVHFKYIGHPLFGDPEYGGERILRGLNTARYKQFIQNCFKIMPRQALHARTLGLTQPNTGERLLFASDLPADFQEVINKWTVYSAAILGDSTHNQ